MSEDDDQDLGDFIDPPGGLIAGVHYLVTLGAPSWWDANCARPETLARLLEMLDD